MLRKTKILLLVLVVMVVRISAIPIGEVITIDIPWILDANDDGSILVGGAEGGGGAYWTEDTGVVYISASSEGSAISENGIIAGKEVDSNGNSTACWWDINTLEPNFLGSVQADQTNTVNAINNDGSVIVGLQWYSGGMGSAKAYKWTPVSGSVLLPDVLNWSDSRADCITADGSIIGGYAAQERSIWRPVLWNETDIIELPYILDSWSTVSSLSPNGDWCAGYNGNKGAIWNNLDLVALEGDDLEFIHTHFRTITDDGWAGGEIANWNNMVSTPILWNPEDSLMNAIDFFVDNGVNIPEDYELFRIRWISNDHLTFVCNGTDLNTYQYKSCILKIPGPHAVSSFKVEVEDFNNVNLSWNFDENTPDALSIVIFRDGAEIVQLLPSNTEYMDEDVEEGNHQYEIYVTYTGYENSVSRFAEADVILSNPTELSYNFGDVYNVLDLNWIAPQLLRSLTGYQIYRDDELLEEISIQTTFEDTDVPNGIHTYKVRAVFGAGNFSDFSNELEIWIANEAPLNFDGVLQGEHSVNLSWESPNPDNPNITGYNLYRNEELIAELDAESTSYLDENLEDDEYNYYVTAIYYDLFESEASDIFNITITGSSNNTLILAVTELVGNYPNPFNPITTINYSLADEGDVELTVYNIKGQKVSILVNEIKDSGHYQAVWDGTDNNKKQVASGVYFYRLSTGEKTINKKMLLLK